MTTKPDNLPIPAGYTASDWQPGSDDAGLRVPL